MGTRPPFPKVSCPKCNVDVTHTILSGFAQPGKRFCFNCGLNLLTFLTPLNIACPKCNTNIGHLISSEAFYGPGERYCVGCTTQVTGRCSNENCQHDVNIFQAFCEFCGTPNPFVST